MLICIELLCDMMVFCVNVFLICVFVVPELFVFCSGGRRGMADYFALVRGGDAKNSKVRKVSHFQFFAKPSGG